MIRDRHNDIDFGYLGILPRARCAFSLRLTAEPRPQQKRCHLNILLCGVSVSLWLCSCAFAFPTKRAPTKIVLYLLHRCSIGSVSELKCCRSPQSPSIIYSLELSIVLCFSLSVPHILFRNCFSRPIRRSAAAAQQLNFKISHKTKGFEKSSHCVCVCSRGKRSKETNGNAPCEDNKWFVEKLLDRRAHVRSR